MEFSAKIWEEGKVGWTGGFYWCFCLQEPHIATKILSSEVVIAKLFFLLLVHFSIEMGEQPLVKTVANIFREICYDNRDQLTAGIICAGWDKREGGQVCTFEWNVQSVIKNCILVIVFSTVVGQRLITSFLSQVFSIPLGGMCVRQPFAIGGKNCILCPINVYIPSTSIHTLLILPVWRTCL